MTKPEIKTYYIVRVKLHEARAFDGSIITKDGEEGALCWSEEGGGWPQIYKGHGANYKFKKPPSKKEIAGWNKMPWYCEIKSAEIIEVTEERYYKKTEKKLGPAKD